MQDEERYTSDDNWCEDNEMFIDDGGGFAGDDNDDNNDVVEDIDGGGKDQFGHSNNALEDSEKKIDELSGGVDDIYERDMNDDDVDGASNKVDRDHHYRVGGDEVGQSDATYINGDAFQIGEDVTERDHFESVMLKGQW